MAAKRRRGMGKHAARHKKKKGQRRPETAAAPSPVVVGQAAGTAAPPRPAVPQVTEAAPRPAAVAGISLNIVAELKRVAVLGGIILAILVVLALVLG